MIAAFFDCDGTLTRTTVLQPLIWYQRQRLGGVDFLYWSVRFLASLPSLYIAERRDRSDFVKQFLKWYRGLRADDLTRWHEENFEKTLKKRVRVDGLKAIKWHKERGHKVVLVTGGMEPVVEPLARWLSADLIATRLRTEDNLFTGECEGPPVIGPEKARRIRALAEQKGWDLSASFAYGDSVSDYEMLAVTGHPVAVNPDRRLLELAQENGWTIVFWK